MSQLDVYIAQLRKSLPRDLGARYRARILQELQEHLVETAAAAQETGLSEDDAWRQAIRRCGTPQEIAGGFLYIIETRRARRIQYALLPLLVMCFGLVSLAIWRFPAITGTARSAVAAVILCAVLLGGYGWFVTVTLGLAQRALWRGARVGLMIGLLGIITMVLSLVVEMWLWKRTGSTIRPTMTITDTLNGWAVALPIVGWIALTSWEGARQPISLPVSMATGVISGVFAGLVVSIGTLGITTALSGQLAVGVWRHDTTCMFAANVVRCEMNDTLGGLAFLLLFLPLFGMSLAAVGQLTARGVSYLRALRSPGLPTAADPTLIPPLTIFTIFLIMISCCAIVVQLL
jgi:hypothetical protein